MALRAKNRAFRSNLLAAPKGFPLQSLAPHGLTVSLAGLVSSYARAELSSALAGADNPKKISAFRLVEKRESVHTACTIGGREKPESPAKALLPKEARS